MLILVSLLIISVLLGAGCNGSGTTAITNKKIKELIVYGDPEMSCLASSNSFLGNSVKNTNNINMNYFCIGNTYMPPYKIGMATIPEQFVHDYAFFQFSLKLLIDNGINSKNLQSVTLMLHNCGKSGTPGNFGDLMVDMVDYKILDSSLLKIPNNNLKKLEVEGALSTNDFYYNADYSSEVKSLLDNKQQYIQFRLKHSIDYGQTKSNGSEYINNSKADDKYAPKLIIEYEVYE